MPRKHYLIVSVEGQPDDLEALRISATAAVEDAVTEMFPDREDFDVAWDLEEVDV